MDVNEAWMKITEGAKWAGRKSATGTVNTLDALTPICTPLAVRWDAEADRRAQLRTPEHLKALMASQREHNSARATAAQARAQRTAARKGSKNPLAGARRAARTADKAARGHHTAAKASLKAARKNYPATLNGVAVRVHAVHAVPAGLASVVLSLSAHDVTAWPGAMSASVIGLNAVALWLGRRGVSAPAVPEGLSEEESALMGRLDPAYWVEHAADRGLSGTVTGVPAVGGAGIECQVRLDGTWTVAKLQAAEDNVRALLGARTALPMRIGKGERGGWAVITLRTRSAADGADLTWTPGAAFGVNTVTGADVAVPLGQRMLIAGRSGAGKSWSARPLLFDASEGETNVLVIIDLKKVEARNWEHRARTASTPADVIALVEELVEEMTERLDLVPRGRDTIDPSVRHPRITVFVDEGSEVVSAAKDALPGLESIARMGRAACIDLWWATQKPTMSGASPGIPSQIAPQLSTVVSLAVSTPTEARTVLGEDAQAKGWNADELPAPGYALVRSGPASKPDQIRTRALSPMEVVALPDRPIWSRAGSPGGAKTPVPAATPAATGRPALTLVKQVPAPAEEAAAAPAGMTNRDKVLQAVIDGARTGRDITDRTELNKGTVSKLVKQLVDDGAIVRAADGSLNAGEVSA